MIGPMTIATALVGHCRWLALLICWSSLTMAGEALQRAVEAARLLARTPAPAMHLDLGEPELVDVKLHLDVVAPKVQAQRWQFVVAGPAPCDGQRVLSAALSLNGKRGEDRSPWHRPLLLAEIDGAGGHETTADATYTTRLELRRRVLSDGAPSRPAEPLNAGLRTTALAATPLIDWDREAFQQRLDADGLRPKAGEHTVAFTRRVLRHVRGLRYAYDSTMDRHASHIIAEGAGDCGGLCVLTVATLRAAGIPARILAGRWAKSAKPDERLEGVLYRQWHVKMEFHLDGIGWVPADASIELERPDDWFGRQEADSIAFHIDPEVRPLTIFGERELTWAQNIAFWVRGEALDGMTTAETWTVTPVK